MSAIQLWLTNPVALPVPDDGSALLFIDADGVLSYKRPDGTVVASGSNSGGGGSAGPAGPVGPMGPQGAPGSNGAASTVAGPMGPQGAPGSNGVASTVAGPMGPQGAPGAKGDAGAKGDPGAAGAPGSGGAAVFAKLTAIADSFNPPNQLNTILMPPSDDSTGMASNGGLLILVPGLYLIIGSIFVASGQGAGTRSCIVIVNGGIEGQSAISVANNDPTVQQIVLTKRLVVGDTVNLGYYHFAAQNQQVLAITGSTKISALKVG